MGGQENRHVQWGQRRAGHIGVPLNPHCLVYAALAYVDRPCLQPGFLGGGQTVQPVHQAVAALDPSHQQRLQDAADLMNGGHDAGDRRF